MVRINRSALPITRRSTLVSCWLVSLLVSLLVIALTISTGCRTSTVQKSPDEITVAAASSMSEAFAELSQQFEAQEHVKVSLNFAATADLTHQIENGAPFDVFAAADTAHVVELEQKGLLLADSSRPFARGELVLWIPATTHFPVAKLEDLAADQVQRIGYANPELAPYGKAAVEVMRAKQMDQVLASKGVMGENVAQVRQFAVTGNVDAAFLPKALAPVSDGTTIEIDQAMYSEIVHSLCVIRSSPHAELARKFAQFILSEAGRRILARHRYRAP